MISKTGSFNNWKDSFLEIRSIGRAFLVRGLELILLSAIAFYTYFYVNEWNFATILAIGVIVVTIISYSFYRGLDFSKQSEQEEIKNYSSERESSFWSGKFTKEIYLSSVMVFKPFIKIVFLSLLVLSAIGINDLIKRFGNLQDSFFSNVFLDILEIMLIVKILIEVGETIFGETIHKLINKVRRR